MNQEVLKAKETIVNEIVDRAKNSNSIVICEYRGLSVADLTKLRRSLRESDSLVGVYKNSLVTRAVDLLGYQDLNSILVGPNIYIFSKDTIAGPKVLVKFAKTNDKLIVKGGVVEGKIVDVAQMKVIATLPGREGLISMFLSCLQAPIRNFACAVKAVADARN